MLRPGWYVLLYHQVSWEEPPELRGIGGMTVPPDRFEEQLRAVEQVGRLCSPDEARERLATGKDDEALVSVWFDDGYAGVRRYAAPALARREVSATISICSRFTLRREMYWRAQLARLATGDGLRFLRSRLRRMGIDPGPSLKNTTMDRFSPELRDAIEQVYRKRTSELHREDAFRLFDTVEGLNELADEGWTLANHSASHWPIGEASALAELNTQFSACDTECAAAGLALSDDWVLPFDRVRSPDLDAEFDRCAPDRWLVLVGNRVNDRTSLATRRVHRIVAPPIEGPALVDRLNRSARS